MSRQFTDTAAAEVVLENIKAGKYIKNTAYALLNQIINDLPGTKVAKEAEELKKYYK